jgi:TfoX/Sxy family transcriptional regulator of competence genes
MPSKKKSPHAGHPLDSSFEAVASAFRNDRQVTQGLMMASYGLKVNGKIFAMYGRSEFVVKLPKPRVDELVSNGTAKRFEPGPGRVMKEWAAFKGEKQNWMSYAQEAYDFVKAGMKK